MRYWYATSPLVQQNPPPVELSAADLALVERLAREGFGSAASAASPAPVSSMGADAEPVAAASSPGWSGDTPWPVAPAPQPGPRPVPTISEDPFERFTTRMRRSVFAPGRRGPSEPPRDYPSYLGPVPRGPDWEEVPAAATPWSPLARPPHATDWDRYFAGGECYASEEGLTCTTQGGRTVTVPDRSFRPGTRIAPGDRFYHSYRIPDGPVTGVSSVMQGVVDRPTQGPPWPASWFVRPASPEGTRNQATPRYVYFPTGGFANGPVRSYVTTDQTGERVVVNVTEPSHPFHPGVVIRYETQSPAGSTIRNEGIGRGWPQGPGGLASGRFNNWVWEGQAQEILENMRAGARKR